MLKKIGLLLVALLILLTLVSFFLPPRYEVERSIVIKAPVADIFQQVNDFKNWEKWSPWMEVDPNLALTYGHTHKGKGAVMRWTSTKFDAGEQRIMRTYPNDSLITNLSFDSGIQGKGKWTFKALDTQTTKVDWINSGRLGNNPVMKYVGLTFDRRMGDDYAKGLEQLKAICEQGTEEQMALQTYDGYEMSEVDVRISDNQNVLTILDTVPTKELFQQFDRLYQELFYYVARAGGKPVGGPLMIYHSFNKEQAIIEVGIPLIKKLPSRGRIQLKRFEEKHAAMVMYKGRYDHLRKAHQKIRRYLKENNLKQSGPEWEFFATSPQTEKDPRNWTTIIHYPIE